MQYTIVLKSLVNNEDNIMNDSTSIADLTSMPPLREAPLKRKLHCLVLVNVTAADWDLSRAPGEGDYVKATTISISREGKLVLPKFSSEGTLLNLIV